MLSATVYLMCWRDAATCNQGFELWDNPTPRLTAEETINTWKAQNPDKILVHAFDANADNVPTVDTEAARFALNAPLYGFKPEDYKREFKDFDGNTYQLYGFKGSNRKYKVLVRNLTTGKLQKSSTTWVKTRLEACSI